MACPKSVVNCPDRAYSAKNATKEAKPVNLSTTTIVIGNKKFTMRPIVKK